MFQSKKVSKIIKRLLHLQFYKCLLIAWFVYWIQNMTSSKIYLQWCVLLHFYCLGMSFIHLFWGEESGKPSWIQPLSGNYFFAFQCILCEQIFFKMECCRQRRGTNNVGAYTAFLSYHTMHNISLFLGVLWLYCKTIIAVSFLIILYIHPNT